MLNAIDKSKGKTQTPTAKAKANPQHRTKESPHGRKKVGHNFWTLKDGEVTARVWLKDGKVLVRVWQNRTKVLAKSQQDCNNDLIYSSS